MQPEAQNYSGISLGGVCLGCYYPAHAYSCSRCHAPLCGPQCETKSHHIQVSNMYCSSHRRRIEREAKAKVVASVWGADFVQFPAALADLPRSIWKKRLNSSYSSKSRIRSGSATLRGRFLTRIYLQEVL